MLSTASLSNLILFDAGVFIAALLRDDPRHAEARPLVEAARHGAIPVCTTPSILAEVYGALTWEKAQPCHVPEEAATAVRLLVEPPSLIHVLVEGIEVVLQAMEMASACGLTARRVHDARHAAAALVAGVRSTPTIWMIGVSSRHMDCESKDRIRHSHGWASRTPTTFIPDPPRALPRCQCP